MTPFNKIVLTIATVVLIISLVVVVFLVIASNENEKFPPLIPDCPDYWDLNINFNDNDHTKSISCINRSTVNTPAPSNSKHDKSCASYDVLTGNITAEDNLTHKCNWATKCNVVWDGVTNNPAACQKQSNDSDDSDSSDSSTSIPNGVIVAVIVGAIVMVGISMASAKKSN